MQRFLTRRSPSLLFLVLLFFTLHWLHVPPTVNGDEDELSWLDDIDTALERSAEHDRPVLLTFR